MRGSLSWVNLMFPVTSFMPVLCTSLNYFQPKWLLQPPLGSILWPQPCSIKASATQQDRNASEHSQHPQVTAWSDSAVLEAAKKAAGITLLSRHLQYLTDLTQYQPNTFQVSSTIQQLWSLSQKLIQSNMSRGKKINSLLWEAQREEAKRERFGIPGIQNKIFVTENQVKYFSGGHCFASSVSGESNIPFSEQSFKFEFTLGLPSPLHFLKYQKPDLRWDHCHLC